MSQADDRVVIGGAIQRLFDAAGLPWPPPARRTVTPVPLDTLIQAYNLTHDEVPALSRAAAGAYLARWGVHRPELLEDAAPLAGFLFANAHGGYILVNAGDPLPRRRFTAAHELGHYLLHFLPRLQAARDVETSLVLHDNGDTVREEDKEMSLPEMERQANQFAAELLMPETVCRTATHLYAARFRTPARFLEHHLAGDLLVSRDAMRWRLRNLNLTN
ncbi:MAG TPA: ImmA/IrrE family metallo-endopeptidase [Gemmataceae bacterium]|nr:ImmA/IrrE family metallo-endopeptidase [Gemmataceae bacterium]